MAPFLRSSSAVKPQIAKDVMCEISSHVAGPVLRCGVSVATRRLTPDGSALPLTADVSSSDCQPVGCEDFYSMQYLTV